MQDADELFWYPEDPNVLQLIAGLMVGLFSIGVVVLCIAILLDLWSRR